MQLIPVKHLIPFLKGCFCFTSLNKKLYVDFWKYYSCF